MNTRTKISTLIVVLTLALAGTALAFGGVAPAVLNANKASAQRWQAAADFYGSQPSAQQEASAQRWQAMADLYGSHSSQIPVTGKLSQEEVSAQRWQGMASLYASQTSRLTPEQVSAIRWNAMAQFYLSRNIDQ